jgi:hypothetical protein
MNGLTSFEDISTRVGLKAKKSFLGTQDSHDTQKFTGKQRASKRIKFQWQAANDIWIQRCKELHDKEDGILTARDRNTRTPSKIPGNLQQCSFTEHTRQANFRQTNGRTLGITTQ